MAKEYFQDYMHGNVCFGCGKDNPDGLQIKSYWEGEDAVCIWESKPMYHGSEKVLNGCRRSSIAILWTQPWLQPIGRKIDLLGKSLIFVTPQLP